MRKCCKTKPVLILNGGEKLCKACFLEYFERKVRKTIRVHKLIGKKEKVLVAYSGGKDSTVALYLLNKMIKNKNISIEAFHVDVSIGNYSKENLKNARKFCKEQGINLIETSFRKEFGYSLCYIKSLLGSRGIKLKSCNVCGTLRRQLINRKARELKVTKVVTGHNLDDEAQNIIMNMFKNSMPVMARLGPVSGITGHKLFVPKIKPLYFCTDEETKLYSELNNFPVVYEKCPCSSEAYRRKVKHMLNEFEDKFSGTKSSIVRSFLEISPMMKKKYKGKVNVCNKCGEPSAKDRCNSCNFIGLLKR